MRKVWTLVATLALVAIDQLIKWRVSVSLAAGRTIRLGNFIALRYVENTGAAFSMLSGKTMILTVGTGLLILAGFVAIFSGKIKDKLLYIALTGVLAGGIGNLVDRIRLGYVVDFIETLFVDFAVFNFADCLITVGAFMMVAWMIVDTVREKKKKSSEGKDSQT